MKYRQGESAAAKTWLEPVHEQRPEMFPVESLNASMLLAAIYADERREDAVEAVLEDALGFYCAVEHDFEVQVNFRLKPWFLDATQKLTEGRLCEIRPYAFPY